MATLLNFIEGGKQTSQGLVASAFTSLPVLSFETELKKDVNSPEEAWGSQERNRVIVGGNQVEEWSAKGEPYNDTLPIWLLGAATGSPTTTSASTGAYQHVFKPANAPAYISLRWYPGATQAYQSLDCVVDELTISWGGDDQLEYSVKGMGMPETTIATPTPSYTTTRPLKHWMATVTLAAGNYARLLKGEITIKRNISIVRASGSGVNPTRFVWGNREVSFKGVLDFTSTTDYAAAVATQQQALQFSFVDTATTIGASSNPTLKIDLPDARYTSHKIDSGGITPMLTVEGIGLWNSAAAASVFYTVINTVVSY